MLAIVYAEGLAVFAVYYQAPVKKWGKNGKSEKKTVENMQNTRCLVPGTGGNIRLEASGPLLP